MLLLRPISVGTLNAINYKAKFMIVIFGYARGWIPLWGANDGSNVFSFTKGQLIMTVDDQYLSGYNIVHSVWEIGMNSICISNFDLRWQFFPSSSRISPKSQVQAYEPFVSVQFFSQSISSRTHSLISGKWGRNYIICCIYIHWPNWMHSYFHIRSQMRTAQIPPDKWILQRERIMGHLSIILTRTPKPALSKVR